MGKIKDEIALIKAEEYVKALTLVITYHKTKYQDAEREREEYLKNK